MLEIEQHKTATLSLTTPSTATNVTLTLKDEWGNNIFADQAATGSGTSFAFALTATHTETTGIRRAHWKYTVSSTQYTKDEYFRVFRFYVTATELFKEFPELEDPLADSFKTIEKKIRSVIDTYCGQPFDYYGVRTLKLDGTGGNTLHSYNRINSLSKVLRGGTEDITEYCEVHPESPFYIRRKNPANPYDVKSDYSDWDIRRFFKRHVTYHVEADYGWPYIPQNVEEAAKILISDYVNQDSSHRRYNVIFSGVGPIQNNYKTDTLGTTGNVDADVLLMDYTRFVMEYV